MTTQCFTIGVYENLWVYVRLLALEAQKIVREGILDKIQILWYKLDDKPLLDWIKAVENGHGDMHPYPFGERPYLLEIRGKEDEIPGLIFTGQRDIPKARIKKKPEQGCFGEENHIYLRSLPNLIVVDHHLFDLDTTGVALRGPGHAHIIVRGLRKYCGGNTHTPPIFLSSQKSLAGTIGFDTLRLGRGQGARVSWFPRPQGDQPNDLPEGFAQAFWEEVGLWLRNRDVLGSIHEDVGWRRYNAPFEHIAIYYDRRLEVDESQFEDADKVVFLDHELSNEEADGVMARHCKAYLEVHKVVSQADVNRLRKLAEQYPLPITLLYWDTAPNVGNLADCGVMAHLVNGPEQGLSSRIQEAAIKWTQRMAALDTIVGSQRLREIRDDLLRWRLGSQTTGESENKLKPVGHAMLVVGPTGAGKTAVSKWCHFYSNHIKQDDQDVRDMWESIHVPNPAHRADRRGQGPAVLPLREAANRAGSDFLHHWARTLIEDNQRSVPDETTENLLHNAFKTANAWPRQLNLVGVTTHDEFVMQMAGAFPSWTGALGASDWRPGAVLSATNNSLILNEVGELESEAQGMLLELIERDGPIRPMFAPIGGEVKAKNVLFIMATDRVDRIRDQLLYRCRIVRVPSLLECQEDIPEFARHRLLPRWCCLSERAEQILKDWPYWPGNHRSLHAVLDFAAERLPSNLRVIRAPYLIRALWREELIRIPTRLESLVKWILEWPELDAGRYEVPVLTQVAANLASLPEDRWASLVEKLNRIAAQAFENPSAHFTHLLRTKKSEQPTNKPEFVSTAIGLLVHEIFLTLEKRTSRLEAAIKSGKKARDQRLDEIAGTDFERRLVKELIDDAVVTLSLGTLLWRILGVQPAEIAKSNDLLRSRDRKPSGRRGKGGESISEDQTKATETNEMPDTSKRGGVPIFDDSKISQIISSAGQYSLAVVKALDSPLRRSFFDYAEDRRDRTYFSHRRRE